jgi:hypothetical protein
MRLADEVLATLRSRAGDNAQFAHLSKEGVAICDVVERRLNRAPTRTEVRHTVTTVSRDSLAKMLEKLGRRK